MIGINDNEPKLPIPEGADVECMILEVTYPKTYLEKITEENMVSKEKSEALALPFTPKSPSFKEGGMSILIGITKVNGSLPENTLYTTVNHLPLPEVWRRSQLNYDKGYKFGYTSQYSGLSEYPTKQGNPTIIKLHPNPNITQDKTTNVWANEIPAGEEDAYFETRTMEEDRQRKWEEFVGIWKNIDEMTAVQDLYEGISRRLCLASFDLNTRRYGFLKPQVGTVFNARTKYQRSFWGLELFKWDMDLKIWKIFSNLDTAPATEENKAKAKEMLEQIEILRRAIRERELDIAKNTAEYNNMQRHTESEPDEVPF